MTAGVQLDLLVPRSPERQRDEDRLLARLREVDRSRRFHAVNGLPGFSRAAIKRLMTPLPPITVPK
jgi:hypothetical protein